jgi:hypothetical protein
VVVAGYVSASTAWLVLQCQRMAPLLLHRVVAGAEHSQPAVQLLVELQLVLWQQDVACGRMGGRCGNSQPQRGLEVLECCASREVGLSFASLRWQQC